MSPPGKKSGLTTKLSVVKASRPACDGSTALSWGGEGRGDGGRGMRAGQAGGLRSVGERHAERRQEQRFDEVPHQPSAAAVRQLHGGVVAEGNGASQIEVVAHVRFLFAIGISNSPTTIRSVPDCERTMVLPPARPAPPCPG